jgi:hypothetical protein
MAVMNTQPEPAFGCAYRFTRLHERARPATWAKLPAAFESIIALRLLSGLRGWRTSCCAGLSANHGAAHPVNGFVADVCHSRATSVATQ